MKALKWTSLWVLFLCLVCGHGTGPGESHAAKAKKGKGKSKAKARKVISRADMAALKALTTQGARRDPSILTLPGANGQDSYTVFHMEFLSPKDCKNFNAAGAHVITKFQEFADLFVRDDDGVWAKVLDRRNNIRWVDIGRKITPPPLPPAKVEKGKSRAIPDAIVRGGLGKLTGKGTIIVIVDTGLDFGHPDFIRYDDGKPVSRLLYFWDTINTHADDKKEQKAPATYPNGAPIGALYTRADLTAKLRSGAPKGFPGWDVQGHGTACASIAAGRNQKGGPAGEGAKPKPVGVAPDADLIAVRVAEGPSFTNDYLLGRICAWVNEVAGKRPAVISCSFGGQYAGRDGNLILERQVSARFAPKVRGRAICIAAGNEGWSRLHGQTRFTDTDKGELKWTPNVPVILSLYVTTNNLADVQMDFPGTDDTATKVWKNTNGISRQAVITVQLAQGQKGEMRLTTKSGKRAVADAYIYGQGAEFDSTCARASEQIATPGTIPNAITVGSYDWNDLFHMNNGFYTVKVRTREAWVPIVVGGLSAYSNPGYLRNSAKIVKPDLVAPGQYFSAAASQDAAQTYLRDSTGKYVLFNGTSAATPYTAGVIALIMQKKPQITNGELKKLFQKHCQKDDYTGNELPNVKWGRGKLNYKAVEKILDELND